MSSYLRAQPHSTNCYPIVCYITIQIWFYHEALLDVSIQCHAVSGFCYYPLFFETTNLYINFPCVFLHSFLCLAFSRLPIFKSHRCAREYLSRILFNPATQVLCPTLCNLTSVKHIRLTTLVSGILHILKETQTERHQIWDRWPKLGRKVSEYESVGCCLYISL